MEIFPWCRLCGEENDKFCHFVTDCPRVSEDLYEWLPQQQDDWKPKQIMQFNTYPTVYNLMSYIQDNNEQPIYVLDVQYSEDSETDNMILQNLWPSYL